MQETTRQKSFLSFIRELRNGAVEEELACSINALTAEVQATGNGGELVFKLKITPNKNLNGVVFVADEIKINSPKRDRASSIFYVDTDNNLVRSDPRQMNISDLNKVEPDNKQPKSEVTDGRGN